MDWSRLTGWLSNRFHKSARSQPAPEPVSAPQTEYKPLELIDGFNNFIDIGEIARHIIKITGMNPDSSKVVMRAWHKLAEPIGYAYQAAQRRGNSLSRDFLKLYTIIFDIADRLDKEPEYLVLKNLPEESRKFLTEHANVVLEKAYTFLNTLPLDVESMREELKTRSDGQGIVLPFRHKELRAKDAPNISDVNFYLMLLTDPSALARVQSANHNYLTHGA